MARVLSSLLALFLLLALILLYRPALSFALMGDDYQWVQHAHRATHVLRFLLADLDSFYRPANTWTLVADRLLWGRWAGGYHLTNLLLQWLAAVALAGAAGKLGLGVFARWAVASLWALSPFSEESAVSVAIRFENLLLVAWAWLVVSSLREGPRGSKSRLLALALAVASKETWVVTPLLVFSLAYGAGKKSLRESLKASLPTALLSGTYVVAYFLAFPGDKSYFRYELASLRKIPHMLAAFFQMETPVPVVFPLSWRGVLALVLTGLLVALVVARRDPLGSVGAFFLAAPLLPTLFVPYLPARYAAIPYAGFLFLLAAHARWLRTKAGVTGRKTLLIAAAGLCPLVLAAQVMVVRADLRDWRRVSQAHAHLVQHAEKAKALFPTDRPVAIVRADGTNVLRDVALSVEGWPKLLYVRGSDPGGLIDAAALFQWVMDDERLAVRPVKDEERVRGRRGAALMYTTKGFSLLASDEPDLGASVAGFRARGFPVRVVEAYRLPKLAL